MNFSFTFEQEALADALRKCIDGIVPDWPSDRWADPAGLTALLIRPIAELGLPSLLVPEASGGAGLGLVDALPATMAAAGRLVPYPVAEMLVASRIAATSDSDVSDSLVSGAALATAAWCAELKLDGSGKLSGTLDGVAYLSASRWLVARARSVDGSAFVTLVDLEAHGVDRRCAMSFDVTAPGGSVRMSGAMPRTAIPDSGEWQRFLRVARVIHAADLVGSAARAHAMALEYANNRSQFGRLIAHNQALRHLLADDFLRLENARLSVAYAAWAHDSDDASCDTAALTAKAYSARAARQIVENAIQVHGGIGFTWDMPLHVFLRRILRLGAVAGGIPQLFAELGRDFLQR